MSFARPFRTAALAAGVAVLVAAPQAAQAAALTAEEVLKQFNLVVFGDMKAAHDVEGRALITGNLNGGSAQFFIKGASAPASTYDALTIGGNNNLQLKVNDGGTLAIKGDNNAPVDLNGGGSARIQGSLDAVIQGGWVAMGATVVVPDFTGVMAALSAQLKAMTANATVTPDLNNTNFNASGVGSTAVFNIADGAAFFAATNAVQFTLGGASTVIVNVGGTDITFNENWLGAPKDVADNIIWNFYEAETLAFETEYFGSILAPNATVYQVNALNGSIVVGEIATGLHNGKQYNGGEIHQYQFSGDLPDPTPTDVPEPAALGMLGLGLIGLATTARRRRKR